MLESVELASVEQGRRGCGEQRIAKRRARSRRRRRAVEGGRAPDGTGPALARDRLVDHPDHRPALDDQRDQRAERSEEHTSELQSLMRISYAVFCLKKKTKPKSAL